jgi:hypothetical protein
VLLLAQPKLPLLSTLIHPLLIPILSFPKTHAHPLKKDSTLINSQLSKLLSGIPERPPRFVFLNLDGRESNHNLRTISSLH